MEESFAEPFSPEEMPAAMAFGPLADTRTMKTIIESLVSSLIFGTDGISAGITSLYDINKLNNQAARRSGHQGRASARAH